MRSRASHPAGPHGRLVKQLYIGPPLLGAGDFYTICTTVCNRRIRLVRSHVVVFSMPVRLSWYPLCRYDIRMGLLLVLNWAMRRVGRESSEGEILGACWCISLLWLRCMRCDCYYTSVYLC